MDPSPNNYSQRQFFLNHSDVERVASGTSARIAPIREKRYTSQHSSSIETPKKSWCHWTKAFSIVGVILIIILVTACIVVPIFITRLLTTSTTTTSTTTTTIFVPTQCSNYTLDTDVTRLTTYNLSTSGCDVTLYSTATWVRFSGGGATRLASTVPAIYRCGTSATGWYTAALPSTLGTTTTGVVCFSWSSNICNWNSVISVTYCDSFFVFLLVSPSQCSLRYCTE